MSFGIGAYCASISISVSVRPVCGFGSFFFTRPTRTPEMRTSASWASWVASGKPTVTR